MLLVHLLDKLELLNPLARDGLDTGRKSRKPDDSPAAHLFQRVILKIQCSFPEDSIRSDKSVLILERLGVGSSDMGWIGREFRVSSSLGKNRNMVTNSQNVACSSSLAQLFGSSLTTSEKGSHSS